LLTNIGLSVCCIYHKARKFGESSSEESSDSGSGSDCGYVHHQHRHHQSGNGSGGAEKERNGEGAQVEELESDGEPNAYERPSGWKKNKGKRRANGEPKTSGLSIPF
jgi:protein phosphatase 1 regulatory subunit 11